MSELGWVGADALGELRAAATASEGAVRVELSGTADLAAQGGLDRLLGRLHGELVQMRAREITIDLTRLEFMNSSCFKAFVTWIDRVSSAAESERYRIAFVANPAFHWQKRSLHALECFAPELIRVTA